MKKAKLKKRTSFFDPDAIVTQIHQKLLSDLAPLTQKYEGGTAWAVYDAANRQSKDFLKKYCSVKQDKVRLESECFSSFHEVNARMERVNREIRNFGLFDKSSQFPTFSRDALIHMRAQAFVHSVLTDFEVDEFFAECKHSGGSTIGVPYKDTSVEKKFTFPMTCTKRAEPFFREYLKFDFQLNQALKDFNAEFPLGDEIETVTGSRATTVDKTTDKRRMICVEPTLNMFFQQGLMHLMYKRLLKVGLDVMTLPEQHKKMAMESSITASNATIDFSSASDCVSIELLRWLLPPKWFDYLDTLRCEFAFFQETGWTELHMMSSMGNATTFPLETLVFWAYARATEMTIDRKSSSLYPEWYERSNVSVFGDDCILPTNCAPYFIEIMEYVGFQVNKDKSFFSPNGKFRESCGGDYLAGYDVRPFYVKAPQSLKRSSLEPWLYIITNSLLKKYIKYFGGTSYLYDKELFKYIFELMESHNILVKFVPPFFPDDAGLKWSFDLDRLAQCYRFRSEPVHRNKHGTYTFRFCRFVYTERKDRIDDIRYVLWLKAKRSLNQGDHSRNYLGSFSGLPIEHGDPVMFRPVRRLSLIHI